MHEINEKRLSVSALMFLLGEQAAFFLLTEYLIADYTASCQGYVLNNGPYLVNKTNKLL